MSSFDRFKFLLDELETLVRSEAGEKSRVRHSGVYSSLRALIKDEIDRVNVDDETVSIVIDVFKESNKLPKSVEEIILKALYRYRNRPCERCCDELIKDGMNFEYKRVDKDGQNLMLDSEDKVGVLKAYYCPNCGRKL